MNKLDEWFGEESKFLIKEITISTKKSYFEFKGESIDYEYDKEEELLSFKNGFNMWFNVSNTTALEINKSFLENFYVVELELLDDEFVIKLMLRSK